MGDILYIKLYLKDLIQRKATNTKGGDKLLRSFSTFPNGLSGAALLLLRATLGFTAFVQGGIYFSKGFNLTVWEDWLIALLLISSGAALLLGLLTQLFSMVVFFGGTAALLSHLFFLNRNLLETDSSAVYVSVIAISLVLLGPGAFSLDARLFGRREIIIPDN